MKNLLAITTVATALFATQANAAGLDEKYFTVDPGSAITTDLTDPNHFAFKASTDTPTIPSPGDLPKPPSDPQIGKPGADSTGTGNTGPSTLDQINGTIDTLDKIVNLVDKIFTLIAKNQPVVNIKVNYANAVPYGTSHWTQIQGWSKPATKKYSFSYKNLYGSEVVKVVYQVHWVYGGNFNGKGKFLTGVTVEPLSVTTAWGYNVDLTAEVPDSTIANVGTSADPIASMQVQLRWKVHTIMKDDQSKTIYYVQGDGYFKPIGSPAGKQSAVNEEKMLSGIGIQASKL